MIRTMYIPAVFLAMILPRALTSTTETKMEEEDYNYIAATFDNTTSWDVSSDDTAMLSSSSATPIPMTTSIGVQLTTTPITTTTTPGGVLTPAPTTTTTTPGGVLTLAPTTTTPSPTTAPPPCLSSPCLNNSTCEEDLEGGARCLCPRPWMEGVNFISLTGPFCEDRMINMAGPVIINIMPRIGPIAGGTNVTIIGKHFLQFRPYIVRIGHFFSHAILSDVAGTMAFFLTPAVNESDSNKTLPLSVEFRVGFKQQTQFSFIYKGNPDIDDIFPLGHIISGGTTITVTGSNLDAVAYPVMEIIQVHTFTVLIEQRYEERRNISYYSTLCSVDTSKAMHCPLPAFDIPDEFLPSVETSSRFRKRRRRAIDGKSLVVNKKMFSDISQSESDSTGLLSLKVAFAVDSKVHTKQEFTRRKRMTQSGSEIPTAVGNSSLEFILGFQLDGFDMFKDIRETFPNKHLTLYVKPKFVILRDVLVFKPNEMSTLSIAGSGLLDGARMSDYRTTLGLSECPVIRVVDNLLTFAPQTTQPEYHEHDEARCGPHLFAVMVFVGLSENMVGCVRYDVHVTIAWLYGAGCGGGSLLLLAGILGCCCYRRRLAAARRGGIQGGEHLQPWLLDKDYLNPLRRTMMDDYLQPTENTTFLPGTDQHSTWSSGPSVDYTICTDRPSQVNVASRSRPTTRRSQCMEGYLTPMGAVAGACRDEEGAMGSDAWPIHGPATTLLPQPPPRHNDYLTPTDQPEDLGDWSSFVSERCHTREECRQTMHHVIAPAPQETCGPLYVNIRPTSMRNRDPSPLLHFSKRQTIYPQNLARELDPTPEPADRLSQGLFWAHAKHKEFNFFNRRGQGHSLTRAPSSDGSINPRRLHDQRGTSRSSTSHEKLRKKANPQKVD